MVGALEEESEVTLQFAVVAREDDVDVVTPALVLDARQHAPDGLVNEFHLDRVERVHFSNLVRRHGGGNPLRRRLVVAHDAPVVPRAPVTGLDVEQCLALTGAFGVVGR